MEFTKPVLAYAEIWPLIAVLGVACLGVLAEALLARPHRHRAQVLLAGAGLVAALVGTVVVDGALRMMQTWPSESRVCPVWKRSRNS